MAPRERLHVFGQFFFGGHLRAADEHRKHAHVVGERGHDLLADGIARIIQPTFAIRVGYRQPARSNDDDAGLGRSENAFDGDVPFDARLERADVAKHMVLVARLKTVVQPAGVGPAVVAPVVDEDLSTRRHGMARV